MLKILDVRMDAASRSYIDAMHTVLSHKQWISYPSYMLAGLTGIGFRFAVHRRLSAESLTAYNWVAEHFLAGDFIGIASSQNAGFTFSATFPLYREKQFKKLRNSSWKILPS